MVKAARLYSRFLYVESCGQCPACKFGTGEVTKILEKVEAEGASDQDVEAILMRARGSTDGQKCALPTGESLLMQSLVQVFAAEFRGHVGGACPLPRELAFHKIVRLGRGSGQVRLRRDVREQAFRLDVRRLTWTRSLSRWVEHHDTVVVAEQHVPGAERDTAERHRHIDLAETFLAGGAGRRTDRLDPQIELAEGGDVADAPIDDEARPAAVSCQAGHDLTDEGHAQGATSVDHEDTAAARLRQPPPHQDVVLATVDGADRPFESRSTSELPEHDRADRGSVAVFVEDVRCGGHGVGR